MPLLLLPYLLVKFILHKINDLYRKVSPLSQEEIDRRAAAVIAARRDRTARTVASEEFGRGHKLPLSKDLKASVKQYVPSLANADLEGYTFESHSSNFADAKTDMMIYDAAGKTVALGREFRGRVIIWQPGR